MTILNQKDEFKILERHEKYDIKFKNATIVNKNAKLTFKNVSLTDFKQGHIGNCGLIAALGALSMRPEFLSEIAPRIVITRQGIKALFTMFYKGKPIIVTIDDKLPFFNKISNEKLSLIYARSAKNKNILLASLFEKAVVKLACNNFYSNSVGIESNFVFSLFSDCITCNCIWDKDNSKQSVLETLKFELDNKSSAVLSVQPDLIYDQKDINKVGHYFVVMDYNLQHKAVKLYNPNLQKKYFYLSNNLPLSIKKTADPNKGELWITLDQLENRWVAINYLCSKKMYKSVFKVHKRLNFVYYDKTYSLVKYACMVDIKQASTFLINLSLFTYELKYIEVAVFTANNEKQEVAVSNDLLRQIIENPNPLNGEAKYELYEKFDLQPNKYVFSFVIKYESKIAEKVDLLLKIGSVSKCTFEEILEEET